MSAPTTEQVKAEIARLTLYYAPNIHTGDIVHYPPRLPNGGMYPYTDPYDGWTES